MKKIRIATVFSGIGAPEQAFKKNKIPFEIVFACDNGERDLNVDAKTINNYFLYNNLSFNQKNEYIKSLYNNLKKENMMKKSYFANYEIDESNWFEDIRFIDGTYFKNKVDILIGGSPCQSFSIIGKKAGLNDVRGTLFYEYARLISEIQPKVFVYENVVGMMSHNKGKTWQTIKEVFESLGYSISYSILNSKDYGIPQDRKRLFVVGLKDSKLKFEFPKPVPLTSTMFDFLEKKVDTKFYLGKKGFEFVTNPKYKNRARVNRTIIQTQKANQEFNWNGDFVFESLSNIKDDEIFNRAYVGEFNNEKGVIRQLTHRECLRLMGFDDSFKIVVPNVWAYRQAGNSIVVNVLQNIFSKIYEEYFNEEN